MRELDLDAPIQPGVSAAGFTVNAPGEDLPMPRQREQPAGQERLDYGSVLVWLRAGRVHQIGVQDGYRGKIIGTIGVGSSIRDVEAAVGPVREDYENNLVVIGYPGWCFETEQWRGHKLEDNGDARITFLCVFGEASEKADAP